MRVLIAALTICVFAMGAYAVTSPLTSTTTISAKAAKQAAKKAARQEKNAASAVVLPATPVTITPVAQPTPAPTPSATPAQLVKLPPLDLSNMRVWNNAGHWRASEWASTLSSIPWKYSRVVKAINGDVRFTLDAAGAPELKAGSAIRAVKDGLWEAEVTLPQLRDGLVVAPL